MKGEDGNQLAAGERPNDVVLALRAARAASAAVLAAGFRAVAALDARAREAVAAELVGTADPVRRQIDQQHDDLVVAEVQTALGISYADATVMVRRARQVCHVVPRVLTALESGLLDPQRTRVLSPASGRCPQHRLDDVDEQTAPLVVDTLLDMLAADEVTGPWDGPSQRAWRDRVTKAVVRHVLRDRAGG